MAARTQEQRSNLSKSQTARNNAIRQIILKHNGEFDELLRANRISLGLSPVTAETEMARLKNEVERLKGIIGTNGLVA